MYENFDELREAALACRNCKLAETRRNVVFGAGNPAAKLMFIGEGPGENEDLQGEPFVGRGGQLLDRMLSHVGLSRERDVYIANMVKCRPPKNRDPERDELDACMGWLRSQVRLIRPKPSSASGGSPAARSSTRALRSPASTASSSKRTAPS